mmetsp:Transcript_34082/g.111428  ORF Transcript_34082/g.111428 Transcript_34082/m.111428 type:complete len:215 (+) Transcript_34082:1175-1819(+)
MPLCERRRAEASLLPRFGRRERPPQERGGLRGPGLHGQGGAAAGTRVGMRRPLLRGAQPAEPRALLLAPPPLGAALPRGEGDGAARAGRGLRRHRGRAVAAAAGAGRRQGAARGAHVDGQREAHLAACEHRGRHGGGAARRPAGGGGGGAIVGHFLREPRAPVAGLRYPPVLLVTWTRNRGCGRRRAYRAQAAASPASLNWLGRTTYSRVSYTA